MRIDLHTHSSISDGTDSPAELVDQAPRGRAGRGRADRPRHLRRAGRGGRPGRAGRASRWSAGWSCPAPGRAERAPAGLRRRPGGTRRSPRSWRRSAAAGWAGWPGVLAAPGRAGRPGDRGAGAGRGRREPVGRSAAHRRRHGQGRATSRDRTEAFDRFLADGGPAHVPRYAIARSSGGSTWCTTPAGVAVIAHPWGRGREHVLPRGGARTAGRRARTGRDRGGPPGPRPETAYRLRALAAELGLLATGSSDYHGTGKLDHDLGCNTTDPEVFATLLERLACWSGRPAALRAARAEWRRCPPVPGRWPSPTRRVAWPRPPPWPRSARPGPSSGHRVLMVDLDPQACLTFSLGYDPETIDTSVHQVLLGERDGASEAIAAAPTRASTCSRPRSSWPRPSSCC